MTAQTLNELFAQGLKEMYFVEQELTDALDALAQEVSEDDLAQAFEEHREETEGHIDRLEEVFEMIDESPEGKKVQAVQGLISDHEEFSEGDPDQHVLNLFDLAAAEKSEHLEIAAYGNLTFFADQLGLDDAADLLEENLREEQETLDELKQLTEAYDVSSVPTA
ncbi:YciE/YciF ferroxidase family protein [Halegenticoccus soli]|uniref:YciE/YciF ferroxidase family protein n=1 Tax=Halegenticoccus soli TaxID=1985678 RepID=UPI000C6D1892|nr:DUF892 family protein [Halegenticoccus soli]